MSVLASGRDEGHLFELLEAMYTLDRSDEEWLRQSLLALSSLCGSEHNYVGFFYDASNVENFKLWNVCRLQKPVPELAGTWSIFRSMVNPDFVRATFRSLHLGSARRHAFEYARPVLAERERNGYGDFFFVNGLDPSGLGCVLTIGCRQREFAPQGKQAALLKRVAKHLSLAHHYRRRLGATDDPPSGRSWARDQVAASDAALAVPPGIDLEPATHTQLLEDWQLFASDRWSLVDTFKQGGHRYVVARENQIDARAFGALTDRERQVVVHAALGLSNKEIAYALGISHATVRVLMARAAKRLGVGSRRELLAHSTLRSVRRPLESEH